MEDNVLGFWRKKSAAIALVFIIIVASVFGYSYYAGIIRWEAPKVERLTVGVMTLSGPILSSQNASRYAEIINRVKVNESIRAVVLNVDSPGGFADITEMIYLDLLELKKEMTIVLVTNLVQQAHRLADRTAFFNDSRLIEEGETERVFSEPRNELTRRYVTGGFG